MNLCFLVLALISFLNCTELSQTEANSSNIVKKGIAGIYLKNDSLLGFDSKFWGELKTLANKNKEKSDTLSSEIHNLLGFNIKQEVVLVKWIIPKKDFFLGEFTVISDSLKCNLNIVFSQDGSVLDYLYFKEARRKVKWNHFYSHHYFLGDTLAINSVDVKVESIHPTKSPLIRKDRWVINGSGIFLRAQSLNIRNEGSEKN